MKPLWAIFVHIKTNNVFEKSTSARRKDGKHQFIGPPFLGSNKTSVKKQKCTSVINHDNLEIKKETNINENKLC